ncbi:MAG: UDP-N-acetylmuramate--L-alanine ligase [Anaerolineae bacterium]
MTETKHIHLVGIGGIGLSAIARVLLARGYRVSGSDPAPSPITEALRAAGAQIYTSHRGENISPDTDLVVVTSAVSADNSEVLAARTLGIRIAKRREFLGELTAGFRTVAIAGSHGKTTTTALVGLILTRAGLDPNVIVGGMVPEFGSNARIGKGEYFVIEADEYDNAFLGLAPYIAIITNVDYDHPDIFPTREDYHRAFGEFVQRVQVGGALIVCAQEQDARQAATHATAHVIRYGVQEEDDWRAAEIRSNESGGFDFDVKHGGQALGRISLCIPGRHNVLNALAAMAAVDYAGVGFETARDVLGEYRGVGRRFQVRGEWDGVLIVDDYAHHPTEIRATLAAARARYPGRKLWAIFQPHTYTRTRALLNEFAGAFDEADTVIVTEIYAARERDTLGMSGQDIVALMKHRDVHFLATLDDVVDYVGPRAAPGAVVITLGAGDVNRVGEHLAELKHVQGFRT